MIALRRQFAIDASAFDRINSILFFSSSMLLTTTSGTVAGACAIVDSTPKSCTYGLVVTPLWRPRLYPCQHVAVDPAMRKPPGPDRQRAARHRFPREHRAQGQGDPFSIARAQHAASADVAIGYSTGYTGMKFHNRHGRRIRLPREGTWLPSNRPCALLSPRATTRCRSSYTMR